MEQILDSVFIAVGSRNCALGITAEQAFTRAQEGDSLHLAITPIRRLLLKDAVQQLHPSLPVAAKSWPSNFPAPPLAPNTILLSTIGCCATRLFKGCRCAKANLLYPTIFTINSSLSRVDDWQQLAVKGR